MPSLDEMTLDISPSVEINASLADAYKALIRRLTTENGTQDNKPMPMVLNCHYATKFSGRFQKTIARESRMDGTPFLTV
jgi:hypothetical protein